MTNRISRVNQLIRKELSQIILREVEFQPDVLVTLTRVETVPNLSESRVYISCIPEAEQEKVLSVLKSRIWHLQQLLNKRLRMRPIPKIIFLKEKETLEAGRIEEILTKLKR
jgi:ribosome-binding factor A